MESDICNQKSDNFKRIVLENIPLIDVRAPIEFEKGAFLDSINLPIMTDEERKVVGICYKKKGNEEAVKLGHKLVSGEIKQKRVDGWLDFIIKNPSAMIYCFRGGSRSQISQQWIKDAGKDIIRLDGGYKAFRNYLIEQLQPENQKSKPIILGGYTGSGKTILLKKLKNAIDLEGIANHRGSSFGRFSNKQPSQINFENNLAYAIIKHREKGYKYSILEDEGRHVGRCYIPKDLAEYYSKGDMVILETPFEKRVEITFEEYIIESQKEYKKIYGEKKGILEWFAYIKNSIDRIKKRLGGDNYKEMIELLNQAFEEEKKTGRKEKHKMWIKKLLKEYYDPMYQYQMKNTTKNIVFRGNNEEILEYLKNKE
ncbi:MAG: tRNA 2-selenouridine(34) synthase MnmH [Fusobacteriia bacterium 4572_132]|nr:MAG: tRNA 2-selenouridine(34) synthase MnmH [Fusobacteriia bacterium 4572_132]